jgi:hypothetical protein
MWNRFARRGPDAPPISQEMENALSHIKFQEESSSTPLALCIENLSKFSRDEQESGVQRGMRRNLIVVVGRGRRMAAESHHDELKTIMNDRGPQRARVAGDARKTVGDAATAFIISNTTDVSVLVVQAAHKSSDV